MDRLKLIEAVTLVAVSIYSRCWGLHWLGPMETASAIRSWPGPSQWAAMARALELCRTQPSACPGPPSSRTSPEAGAPRALEGLGRRPRSTAHGTFCPEDRCEADCWQSRTSNRCSKGLVLTATRWPGIKGGMLRAAHPPRPYYNLKAKNKSLL